MRLILHGGFGEKGRTSIAVEHEGFRLLIDAGVKTSARGTGDYYPAISPAQLAATDVLLVTHGHEDHAGALGYCLANGFSGRILMTAQTRRDAEDALSGYATPDEHARFRAAAIAPLPVNETFALGPLALTTGRSGHVAGGVWCVVDDGRSRFAFCGDVVPASPVFPMDPVPRADGIAIDASYGADDVAAAQRAAQVQRWVAAHPQGCVLPTPLYGRSAELLAIVGGPVALAPGMRDALEAQVHDAPWLAPAAVALLTARLAAATDWNATQPLPAAALICHDGMGLAGPAREILALARAARHPALLTGHVPEGSPAAAMLDDGLADWIRLPTHPTRAENMAIAMAAGARLVLGHSCAPGPLAELARFVPGLRTDVRTGDVIEVACAS